MTVLQGSKGLYQKGWNATDADKSFDLHVMWRFGISRALNNKTDIEIFLTGSLILGQI